MVLFIKVVFVFVFKNVFIEIGVANRFVACDTLRIDYFVEIGIMEPVIGCRSFEIAMTSQTTGIVYVFFTVASQILPVKSALISYQGDPGIVCS